MGKSEEENPSEYRLIFKRLAYGELEPKNEPLTVLELEGNFAHLKDYINNLTTKLTDNTNSISKMSESIADLEKRVKILEGGSPVEEYISVNYLNTDGVTLINIQKSADEYGKKNNLGFGDLNKNPIFYHKGKRETGDSIYLKANDDNYYALSDIDSHEFELLDDTYSVIVSGGVIISISETPSEKYNSVNYLNTDGTTLNSIQKSANEYGKANGGIDFGSIVDNPFIYHLGKREVGGNLYLGAKDGKYYPLSDINTSEFELVDDTYTVRVSSGVIISISETKTNTSITLVDNTTSVSGNLAKLYLAPNKEAKDQSLIYISETTFSETGEAVFEFDFDSVGQSDGSGDMPMGKALLDEKVKKSFVIAAYANGPQKVGKTPEPYWYDMITCDNSGYTLNRQSAISVILNFNVRLSNDESVESYPLYYGDTKDAVRQLLQIKGFQGQFEITNNKGDTSLELTFDQDLIIYSETFNIGEIAYDAVETTLYYEDLTDGGVYSNTFTLVEISSSTTTTTMAPNFYVNTSNEIDPSTASFEVHQLSDDKSYVNLGNIGTLESTFVSNDKGGYYDFYYRFYADPSYNYEVWINWNNGDGNQIYPAVEIISTTTTTTTTEKTTSDISIVNILDGVAQVGKKVELYRYQKEEKKESKEDIKGEPTLSLIDTIETDSNGLALFTNVSIFKKETLIIKAFDGSIESESNIVWYEMFDLESGNDITITRKLEKTTTFEVTVSGSEQFIPSLELNLSDSKQDLRTILGLPGNSQAASTDENGQVQLTITSDADLVTLWSDNVKVGEVNYNGVFEQYTYDNLGDTIQLNKVMGIASPNIQLNNIPGNTTYNLSRVKLNSSPQQLISGYSYDNGSGSGAQFSYEDALYRLDIYDGVVDWSLVNWVEDQGRKDLGYYEDSEGTRPQFTLVINVFNGAFIVIDVTEEIKKKEKFFVYQLSTDDGNSLFGTDTFSQSSTWDGTYRIVVQNAQPFFQTEGHVNENSIGRQVYYLNTNGGLEPFKTSGYIGGDVEKIILDELGCVLSVNETPTYESVSEYVIQES